MMRAADLDMRERAGADTPWWRAADAAAWRALAGAGAGWMLDAMDFMLYAFALGAIKKEFGLSDAEAGRLAAVTLVAAAVGGVASGVLADRVGRVRMLMVSVLLYSVFTALTATAQSVGQLVVWRVLVGLGLGAEWSAGSVLVAETWPAQHRGKAIGLMQSGWAIGYILAAVLAATVLDRWGWRSLFVVGVAPAVLLVWIRRNLHEPEVWTRGAGSRQATMQELSKLTRPPYLGRLLIATATTSVLLVAYWGLFTWMPSFLARPVEQGGAGLGMVKQLRWMIPTQVGAFLGYSSFGFLADRFGRRPMFLVFVLGAAVVVPIYGLSARSTTALLALSPLVGFLGHGYFSVFGSMLAELFPSSVRGAAQGMCYNFGRAVSAAGPWAIGSLAGSYGLGPALGMTSVLYVAGAGLVLLLPETKGKEIE